MALIKDCCAKESVQWHEAVSTNVISLASLSECQAKTLHEFRVRVSNVIGWIQR